MKKTIFVLFASLFSFSAIFAQVSPTPVINNEIRDISSVRRRSMELERVQKEANQVNYEESSKEQKIKVIDLAYREGMKDGKIEFLKETPPSELQEAKKPKVGFQPIK